MTPGTGAPVQGGTLIRLQPTRWESAAQEWGYRLHADLQGGRQSLHRDEFAHLFLGSACRHAARQVRHIGRKVTARILNHNNIFLGSSHSLSPACSRMLAQVLGAKLFLGRPATVTLPILSVLRRLTLVSSYVGRAFATPCDILIHLTVV